MAALGPRWSRGRLAVRDSLDQAAHRWVGSSRQKCPRCPSGAFRLLFGCLFGLRGVFCSLGCMLTVRWLCRYHDKLRPTRVNRGG